MKDIIVTKGEILSISSTHCNIHTETIINASPEKVWEVFTDFENIHKWSSTLHKIEGELKNGSVITATYNVNGKLMSGLHNLIYEEHELFGWSDPSENFPGVKDSHFHKLERFEKNKTRFIQSDSYQGEDVNTTLLEIAELALPIYMKFNSELKEWVEKLFQE